MNKTVYMDIHKYITNLRLGAVFRVPNIISKKSLLKL